MRKYLPGGRCGGSVMETCKKDDTQPIVNASFNALLAQREAQIATMFQSHNQNQTQTQIVVVQPKEEKKVSKDQIINTILDGDY
jgi:hypothetical protein